MDNSINNQGLQLFALFAMGFGLLHHARDHWHYEHAYWGERRGLLN